MPSDGEATRHDHDPDGKYAAKFSDRDYVRNDDLSAIFELAEEFYDARDYLSGDRNVAVTIGPADAIDFPEVDQPDFGGDAADDTPAAADGGGDGDSQREDTDEA